MSRDSLIMMPFSEEEKNRAYAIYWLLTGIGWNLPFALYFVGLLANMNSEQAVNDQLAADVQALGALVFVIIFSIWLFGLGLIYGLGVIIKALLTKANEDYKNLKQFDLDKKRI